jgi:hypothetical protein
LDNFGNEETERNIGFIAVDMQLMTMVPLHGQIHLPTALLVEHP